MKEHPPRGRFERGGENADPLTRRDETLAFAGGENPWVPPEWFGRIAVVLVEPTDAVNIGGVSRAMANTGFTRLALVNPVAFDPWDVIGVAHYTQHIVQGVDYHASLGAALTRAQYSLALSGKHQRHKRNLLPFHEALREVRGRSEAGNRVAIVFGREDTGLSNDALDHCQAVTTIPTNPAFNSLNLAQAVLLTLYGLFELAAGSEQPLRPPQRHAGAADQRELGHLFADLEHALEAVEFFRSRSREHTLRSLRVALFRAGLDVREARLLRAAFIEVRRFLLRRGVIDTLGQIGASDGPPPEDTPAAE